MPAPGQESLLLLVCVVGFSILWRVASLEELIGTYSGGRLSWEPEDQGTEVGELRLAIWDRKYLPGHACSFWSC